MLTEPQSVYQLKCSCNSHPWGKQGSESLSARLCQNQQGWDGSGPQEKFKIDEGKPYAEMWMGTYPTLPSYAADTGEDIQDVIDRHPEELIGESVINKFGHSKLPFLPKILSIAKSLPLQLHPDIDMAARLHEKSPDAFTDPNHKPEIAIALSQFEAFCGFKPLAEIEALLQLEPLRRFLPAKPSEPDANFTNETLREVVRNMLITDSDVVKQTYSFLTNIDPTRYKPLQAGYIPELAMRLGQQYSSTDPGILVALVTMNYLILQPGQAVYIPADGIHAWLSGDILECMARSDNVLNTGLCPKAERSNVDLFCQCLNFKPHSAEEAMLKSQPYGKASKRRTKIFQPPLSEFNVLELRLGGGGERELLEAIEGPAVFIVVEGDGEMRLQQGRHDLSEGSVFFVAKGVELEFDAGEAGLLAYVAFVE